MFSNNPVKGCNKKKYEKYNVVDKAPIRTNGASTCCDPNQPNKIKLNTNTQNKARLSGRNWLPRRRPVSNTGINNNTNKAPNIAITPPTLEGIDRRIA